MEGRTVSRSQAGQHGRGIPIGDAAAILGLTVDAVRKRIKRGTLRAYKKDERWYVVLPGVLPGVLPAVQSAGQPSVQPVPTRLTGSPVQPANQDEPIEAAYRVAGEAAAEVALVPLATMVEELRGLADQLNAMARRNEALALEVGQLRERQGGQAAQLAAKDETIAELRRRAEAAEVELTRQRDAALEAAQTASTGPGTQDAPEEAPASVWARLRRWRWG